jgi:DNA repair protein RecO (recombination protein O)
MEKAHGIVIRTTKLTDTSLIVHWFTGEAGLIKTVAKGARRPKSPFAGKIDLFVEAEVVWIPSRRSELHTLKEVAVGDFREGLRKRYSSTVLGAYFCQLLDEVVEREHPEPELFDLLKRGLDYAGESPDRRGLLHFEREVARLMGVGFEGMNAAAALERAFGRLPRGRSDCLGVLRESG